MSDALQEFITGSPLAKQITIQPRIVVHRSRITPREAADLKDNVDKIEIPVHETVCDLVVNNEILAVGKIIKKRGEYFFKLKKLV